MAQQPATFPPPPTNVLPVDVDPVTGRPTFNVIWLNWFVQLARLLSSAGGGGGGIFHNSLMGLQGGDPVAKDFYHLDSVEHAQVVANLHNALNGLQGGTAGEEYHLTSAEHTTVGTLAGSTYTPTLTNTTNVAASTAYTTQYLRVGNVVQVGGQVDVDPTTAGLIALNISLPVTSNLGAQEQLGGAAAVSAIAGMSGTLSADIVAHNAVLRSNVVDTANRSWFFTFTYLVVP